MVDPTTGRRGPSADQHPQDPVVQRALKYLRRAPRGASRKDLLGALSLAPATWRGLRDALLDTGEVVVRGRGPGLRLIHRTHLDEDAPPPVRDLDAARQTLRDLVAAEVEIDSATAQQATGLEADAVRRLLGELVDAGVLERVGVKRAMRYRRVAG